MLQGSKTSHYSLPLEQLLQAQFWDFFFSLSLYFNLSISFFSFRFDKFFYWILWWWHIKVKKPRYDKCKYHASKQEIQKAVAMPEVSSLAMVCWCWCWDWRDRSGVVGLIWLLYRFHLSCSSNIVRNRITNFTGPKKIKKIKYTNIFALKT